MGHVILLTNEALFDFARRHNLPLPSCRSDATKAASQPSRPIEELNSGPMPGVRQPSREASVSRINEKLRSAYDRAEAAREKPPNVKEASAGGTARVATGGPLGKQAAD
jgi:hypothetical protein